MPEGVTELPGAVAQSCLELRHRVVWNCGAELSGAAARPGFPVDHAADIWTWEMDLGGSQVHKDLPVCG